MDICQNKSILGFNVLGATLRTHNHLARTLLSRSLLVACIAAQSLPGYAEDATAQDMVNSSSSGEQPISFDTSTDTLYLNGGIGSEEASAMRLKAAEFPLRMTLSEGKNGKSITGANVTITDSKGKTVLQVPDAGPLLYAKLPNGTYKISADYNGNSLNKKVSLSGKKGSNVYLNWKATSEDMQLDANTENANSGNTNSGNTNSGSATSATTQEMAPSGQ